MTGEPLASDGIVEEPIKVFFSYADTDDALCQQLEIHLSNLRKQGVITTYHKREIGAGREWQAEIDTYLEEADIILLLLSADFIDSDYCYSVEMGHAMERHGVGETRVIPIKLRPVDYEGAPFAELESLPLGGKAVTEWENQDSAFRSIANKIRSVVEEIKQQRYTARKRMYLEQYRQLFRRFLEDGTLSVAEQAKLDSIQHAGDLIAEEIDEIRREELASHRTSYANKYETYENAVSRAVQTNYPLDQAALGELRDWEIVLRLRDEDAARIKSHILQEAEKEYQKKLQQYEQAYRQELETAYPLDQTALDRLKNLKQQLRLLDNDAEKRGTAVEQEKYSFILEQYKQQFSQQIHNRGLIWINRNNIPSRLQTLRRQPQFLSLHDEDVDRIAHLILREEAKLWHQIRHLLKHLFAQLLAPERNRRDLGQVGKRVKWLGLMLLTLLLVLVVVFFINPVFLDPGSPFAKQNHAIAALKSADLPNVDIWGLDKDGRDLPLIRESILAKNRNCLEDFQKSFRRVLQDKQQVAAAESMQETVENLKENLCFFKKEAQQDPEMHVYLNNIVAAELYKANFTTQPIRIAASLPISRRNGESDSREVLRGIAIAQGKLNYPLREDDFFTQRKLEIAIVDDGRGDDELLGAANVAHSLVKQKNIWGVIGHFSSDSLEEAGYYYNNNLVAISPTSTATRCELGQVMQLNLGHILCGLERDTVYLNPYIFRTASNDYKAAKDLVRHICFEVCEPLGIIYESDSIYSRSLRREVRNELAAKRGRVAYECDWSKDSFDAKSCLDEAEKKGVRILLLIPTLKDSRVESVEDTISRVEGRFRLLGGDSTYNEAWLDQREGMIIAIPWARTDPPSEIQKIDNTLFEVGQFATNWRTVMAYDATQALAQGVRIAVSRGCEEQGNCRSVLQNVLSSEKMQPPFSGPSAIENATVEFDQYGDRKIEGNLIGSLVKVEPTQNDSFTHLEN